MRKKLMFSLGAILIMGVMILVLMSRDDVENKINVDTSHVEYDENQILIINRTVNYAAGYQDEGIFIDVKGRVYFYCFSQLIYQENPDTEVDFIEKLKDIQEYTKPVMTIEDRVMSEAINLCFNIDATETYETELTAYDAGSRILYVCNGNNMTSCRQSGDFEGALDSVSAKKFMEYFDNVLLPEITSFCEQMTEEEYAGAKAYYYTENALYFENIHCGFLENIENTGKYVVTNKEELTALESILGSDFGIGEWQNEKAVDCIFFIEAINVSSGGYDLKRDGILCQDGEFEMILSEDSKVPQDGEMVSEAFDGFVFVAAFPKDVAELFAVSESGCYFDFRGNEWIRPK
ncbi:MAG: hypothetical protein ACI4AA_01405 [Lachnospiraceae bacterium]